MSVPSGCSLRDHAPQHVRLRQQNIVIGAEAWPFPIPIVKAGEGWHFDTDAGIHEIVKRRIGENELTVIPLMNAYFDAQFAYAGKTRDDSGVLKFARKFHSRSRSES